MRRAFVIACGLAAAPAAAQPVTRPDACGATIAYAPDDVRAVIEDWLRGEPSCSSTLEVRVVPTDGGLYLFARDEHGRVRERVVPDAQSAAVLVASWMADDSRPAPPPPLDLPRHEPPAHVEAPPPRLTSEPVDGGPSEAPRTSAGHWLALGPMLVPHGRGLRAELDLHSWRAWTIGVSASAAGMDGLAMYIDRYNQPMTTSMDIVDATGLASLTRRIDVGGWQLRPSAAIGFTYTRTSIAMVDDADPWNPYYYSIDDDGLAPTAELALRIGHRLGNSWQIDAGPGVMFFGTGPRTLERSSERTFYAAVRYRL